MAAQDEDELFDIFDRDGRPLGAPKARRLVHRDGDWHRSVHIWVLLEAGVDARAPNDAAERAPWVLFQQRSREKDTWPGAIDVAVTGHYRAGERLEDALREAEEEIGLPLTPGEVARLGLRRSVCADAPPIVDRELQDVLLASTRRDLGALRPHPDEVSALLALPLRAAMRLVRREAPVARGVIRRSPAAANPVELAPVEVRLDDFVGGRDDYYERSLDTIRRRLDGELPPPWTIG
jgi:8-oxo-dGTP pyrophosphatase MutT (NUDIX family)